MKHHIKIESIQVPEVKEEHLLQTITQAKMILHQLPLEKKASMTQSIKQIILFHGWRSLLTQGSLVFFLLIIAGLTFPAVGEGVSISFVLVASVTLSVAVSFELYRSDLFQMKELEYTCVYSPQRLFVWKILLLTMISLIGIILLCGFVSYAYQLNFITMVYGGCIPLIILNGTALHLAQRQHTLTVFLILCLSFSLLSFLIREELLQVFGNHGLFCLALSLVYYIGMNVYACKRKTVL